jgi:ABC-type glycerol-3-phosphate transport system substrate-binding protein
MDTTVQRSLIVTFYAYKGGTGRTLALANVARFLADEMGYRVGLVDLDIDSPGLVHEPLCDSLDDGPLRSKLLASIDRHRGFLECFIERYRRLARGETVLPRINDYVVSLNGSGNGSILLVPTAEGSVSKADTYGATVATFMQLLASVDASRPDQPASGQQSSRAQSPGRVALDIFEEFTRTYNLDYLFLDGRTGTGPFAPVYIYAIPHLLVLFLGLNDQNILGSLSIFSAKAEGESIPAPVFLVVSPVPTVGPEKFEERLRFIAAQLSELRATRESENERYIYDLPRGPEHMLPYSDAASFGEVYFPGEYPHSLLARAYRRLAYSIESLVLKESTSTSSLTLEQERVSAEYVEQARHLQTPIRISMEDVHNDLLSDLIDKNFSPEYRPVLSPNSAESGPWERFREIKSEADMAKFLQDLPDILIVPQILLQALTEKFKRPLLHDLSEQRNLKQNPIDYALLDDNYPNWRRWCSVGTKIMALPFSVNAMLFCANEERLAPACRAYWRERGQVPPKDFFLPSSWTAVIDLIRGWKPSSRNALRPFRIVGERRGLYYEWLNLVAALGGFDIIQVEGRLIQEVRLDSAATIEATKLFIELARLCPQEEWGSSMTNQILDFAKGTLPLYVGWTDSFRFDWEEGNPIGPIGISVVPLSGVQATDKTICLGRCPRDMRFPRTSLVDGWLMTFPQKGAPDRLRAALRFAHWFLQPAQQGSLLRRGFPSASGRSVTQEIEMLNARRLTETKGSAPTAERSFEVFLDTMRSAVFEGGWVASPKEGVYEKILAAISTLIREQGADVGAAMRALAAEVRKDLELS